MSFTDTFSEWIHQSIFAHEVSAIRGYAFNLIEDGGDFYIELIGSETFDEVDPDWACDEQFEASPRSIPIPSELHCSDWERCLENMRGVVTKYLAEDFPQAQILRDAEGVGIGFIDGDLDLLTKAEQGGAGNPLHVL